MDTGAVGPRQACEEVGRPKSRGADEDGGGGCGAPATQAHAYRLGVEGSGRAGCGREWEEGDGRKGCR